MLGVRFELEPSEPGTGAGGAARLVTVGAPGSAGDGAGGGRSRAERRIEPIEHDDHGLCEEELRVLRGSSAPGASAARMSVA